MTDQINKMNFISGETFEGKTFDPSEINFVDVTDDILPALNASERFTPRYGLEFNSSTNMNVQGCNYTKSSKISSTSLDTYVLSNVTTYENKDITTMDYNQDGSFNLTDLTGAYAILPYTNGNIIYSKYYSSATMNGLIIGKRVSDTTFIPYITLDGRYLRVYTHASDSVPVLVNSLLVQNVNTAGWQFIQIDTDNNLIRVKYTASNGSVSDTSSISSGTTVSYDYDDLTDKIAECDSVLFIPQASGNNSCFVATVTGSLSDVSKFGDIYDMITNYVTPVIIDKILYLDNMANFVEPDNDTIVIENQKLTSTCQRQFNTGSSLTMTTAMMTGSNGVTLEIQSPSTNNIIPRQCFTVSSVSGTKIDPAITTSAHTGITIPSQNSEGNMVLASPYRYIAFSFNPIKDAFITQGTSASGTRYSRAMLGKIQNDSTFRLLYIQDGQYLFKVSAHNSDGTCDFSTYTFGTTSNNTNTRIMWLDTTNKLMYYYGGSATNTSTLYSDSVTDSFINDFCQCDTIVYSPVTGSSNITAGFGVLHNIGTSGDIVERLVNTTLVQPTETYQKSILTVDTAWLTQFIQDTFGINPQ